MSTLDQAKQTQLNNIQKKTGKSLDELRTLAGETGLAKHGQLLAYFKTELGLGHGDANALAHFVRTPAESLGAKPVSQADVVAELYAGKKAALRPIHEAIWPEVIKLGSFEISPKKKYLSLRRKKQFAMIGPATNTRVEVGLNIKDLPPDPRLIEQPKGSMCNYIVKLTDPAEVDAQLFSWIKSAYEIPLANAASNPGYGKKIIFSFLPLPFPPLLHLPLLLVPPVNLYSAPPPKTHGHIPHPRASRPSSV